MIDIDQIFGNSRPGSNTTIYNNDDIEFRPFAFVLNVKELIDSDHVEVAPGYTLRRAQESEISYIKEFLKNRFGTESGYTTIWENQPTVSGEQCNLPKSLRRYFVIEFSNDEPNLDLLESVLTVSPLGLDIGFAKIRVDVKGVVRPACVSFIPSLFQSLSALYLANTDRDKLMHSLGMAEAEQMRDSFQRMARHDNTILDLSRVMELLRELKNLPRFSPLQILGYFAILESVLTHQPNPEDRYESITRQITQKLSLLNRRWHLRLNYIPFGETSHEKIWKKMYAYRSSIAHGRKPDFESELALLKNADAANTLINEAVKKVICQAYLEPQLVGDLYKV